GGEGFLSREEIPMAKKKEKTSRERLDLESLALQVRRLANELDGIGARLKAITFTGEEVKLLLGELRAVRYLLDRKGEYRHLEADAARLEARTPSSPSSP
ncbi:MAG: hypothetical protein ACRD1Z_12760, partial [Vicinamibacteria bacterium]